MHIERTQQLHSSDIVCAKRKTKKLPSPMLHVQNFLPLYWKALTICHWIFLPVHCSCVSSKTFFARFSKKTFHNSSQEEKKFFYYWFFPIFHFLHWCMTASSDTIELDAKLMESSSYIDRKKKFPCSSCINKTLPSIYCMNYFRTIRVSPKHMCLMICIKCT